MGPNVRAGPLITVTPEPLTQVTFATFGAITKSQTQSTTARNTRKHDNSRAGTENDGSYFPTVEEGPSKLVNLYAATSSKKPAQPRLNVIECIPARSTTTIHNLKRHQYTSLSIIPLNSSTVHQNRSNLIIIAPSLSLSADPNSGGAEVSVSEGDKRRMSREKGTDRKKRSRFDVFARARPAPFMNDFNPPRSSSMTSSVKGAVTSKLPLSSSAEKRVVKEKSGQPDLSRIRAFQIQDDQSIMLSPGIWYALITVNSVTKNDGNEIATPAYALMRYCNGIEKEDEEIFKITSEETGKGPVLKIETDVGLTKPLQPKL